MTRPERPPFLLAALLLLAGVPLAQVEYRASFAPGGEAWEVEASFPNLPDGRLDLWMPRWTAGAYHLADFGRFADAFEAVDETGAPLEVERLDDHQVRIESGAARRVRVRYTAASISTSVFSEGVIDVESNRIARDYAYVNPVSVFGFVPELIDEEVLLEVVLPEGWQAATVLQRDDDGRFRASSYLRFEDSPLFFAPTLETVRFEVEGKPHAVTVHGKDRETVEAIADGCERIVTAGAELMEELPYERYHFLIGFVPEGGGSGLEHADSTLILVNAGLEPGYDNLGFWGVVAHEFWHLWTPERIHVEGMRRPDYTRPFETGTIWFNEGVTEYFTRHLLMHAGFTDPEGMLAGLTTPFPGGRRPQSWTDVSRAATRWTEGGGIPAFVLSMYDWGPRVVLALDLEMRRASFGERGMIDVVRFLQRAYAELDRGFAEDALVGIVNGIAQEDLGAFFELYVDGTAFPDLAPALEVIGYELAGGRPRAVAEPTAAQLAAREDFLAIPR